MNQTIKLTDRKTLEINNAKKPIVSEILPPKSIREKTSRPFISVPSKNNLPSGSTVTRCLLDLISPKNLYGSPSEKNFR